MKASVDWITIAITVNLRVTKSFKISATVVIRRFKITAISIITTIITTAVITIVFTGLIIATASITADFS